MPLALLAAASLAVGPATPPAAPSDPLGPVMRTLSAAEMFELASRAEAAGDLPLAERVLRTVVHDADLRIRSEARFRLALLLTIQKRLREAAILLRQVLDEQPGAQPVRLALARVLDGLGDEDGARRALRQVQAGGLPPEVARFVDRYSAALRARKPLGATLEVALAPDSNINRATRAQTLGTVLGDFVLDAQSKERSGLGLALRGQGYARRGLRDGVNLLGRVSGSADLYREQSFDDLALAVSAGPELKLGEDELVLEAVAGWRWYGERSYSESLGGAISYVVRLSRVSELRATANLASVRNDLNPSLSGHTYSTSLSYERALSSGSGLGVVLSASRQAFADPAYATWEGQVTGFGYRELGPITIVGTLGFGKLEADRRMQLFANRRSDDVYRASLGATFRKLRLREFSPFVRASFETDRSSVSLYKYARSRVEFGLARAF